MKHATMVARWVFKNYKGPDKEELIIVLTETLVAESKKEPYIETTIGYFRRLFHELGGVEYIKDTYDVDVTLYQRKRDYSGYVVAIIINAIVTFFTLYVIAIFWIVEGLDGSLSTSSYEIFGTLRFTDLEITFILLSLQVLMILVTSIVFRLTYRKMSSMIEMIVLGFISGVGAWFAIPMLFPAIKRLSTERDWTVIVFYVVSLSCGLGVYVGIFLFLRHLFA